MAGGGMRGGVDWMRKMAFRFRKIKENYNAYSKLKSLFFSDNYKAIVRYSMLPTCVDTTSCFPFVQFLLPLDM